jgi:hypothetical protein
MGANLLPHLAITDFCDWLLHWLLATDILAQQLFSNLMEIVATKKCLCFQGMIL